jgi:hypothetical protein
MKNSLVKNDNVFPAISNGMRIIRYIEILLYNAIKLVEIVDVRETNYSRSEFSHGEFSSTSGAKEVFMSHYLCYVLKLFYPLSGTFRNFRHTIFMIEYKKR